MTDHHDDDPIPPGYPPGGYGLVDAPRAYLPREIVDACDRARKEYGDHNPPKRLSWFEGGPSPRDEGYGPKTHSNTLRLKFEDLERGAHISFMSMLKSGKLIAFGIPLYEGDGYEAIRIPPSHWDVLLPDYNQNSAQGGRFSYTRVRVNLRSEIESFLNAAPDSKAKEPDPENYRKRPPSGRKSYLKEAEEILRGHAKQSALLEPKIAQMNYIADVLLARKIVRQRPSPVHLKRKLSDIYDALMVREKMEKSPN